jgi:hypothetical protein
MALAGPATHKTRTDTACCMRHTADSSPQQSACHCTAQAAARLTWQLLQAIGAGCGPRLQLLLGSAACTSPAVCALPRWASGAAAVALVAPLAGKYAAACSTGTGPLVAWALYAWRRINAAACTRGWRAAVVEWRRCKDSHVFKTAEGAP